MKSGRRTMYAPMRRFSQTVSSAKMPRPSCTWATPARATVSGEARWAACPRRRRRRPAHGSGDRAQRRRLARAVRAEQRHDLSLVDGQRHPVECGDLPIAGGDVGELEQRGHVAAVASHAWSTSRKESAGDVLAPLRDRPRPLLLAALVDRRLDARRHGSRLARSRGAMAAGARRARRPGRAHRGHPHAPGSRRRCARHRGADRRAGLPGREDHAQCVRAWGERNPQRFVEHWARTGCRGHGGGDRRAGRTGSSSAVHWVVRPTAARARRRDRRLAGRDAARPRRRAHRPHARRRHDRRGHDPRRGSRPSSGSTRTRGPIRSATTSSRCADRGARPARRLRRPRSRSRPGRPRARDPVHHAERLDRAEAALDGTPLNAYEVSLALFDEELSTTLRRFATAESLAHLERLVRAGGPRARRRRTSARRIPCRHGAASDRRSRRAGKLSRARADAPRPRRGRRRGAKARAARRSRRARDPGRRVDDLHAADAALRARRRRSAASTVRSSARAPG